MRFSTIVLLLVLAITATIASVSAMQADVPLVQGGQRGLISGEEKMMEETRTSRMLRSEAGGMTTLQDFGQKLTTKLSNLNLKEKFFNLIKKITALLKKIFSFKRRAKPILNKSKSHLDQPASGSSPIVPNKKITDEDAKRSTSVPNDNGKPILKKSSSHLDQPESGSIPIVTKKNTDEDKISQ